MFRCEFVFDILWTNDVFNVNSRSSFPKLILYARKHQDMTLSSLFPALHWVQIDEVNLASLNGHQDTPKPSASVPANFASIALNSRFI